MPIDAVPALSAEPQRWNVGWTRREASAGFDRPILHGLALYGIVARAVVDGLLEGDAARLTSVDVPFAGAVFPRQTIGTAMWREGDELTLMATCPDQADGPTFTHATARVRT